MVSIDFVSDSQQMKLYDYVEKLCEPVLLHIEVLEIIPDFKSACIQTWQRLLKKGDNKIN